MEINHKPAREICHAGNHIIITSPVEAINISCIKESSIVERFKNNNYIRVRINLYHSVEYHLYRSVENYKRIFYLNKEK